MSKTFYSNFFSFIIGAILFSGITVFAYSITSNEIAFTPENESWEVKNVEEAINNLYIKKFENFNLYTANGFAGASSGSVPGFIIGDYYLCVSNIQNEITTYQISGADIIYNRVNTGWLDYKYSVQLFFLKATSENITFTYPGSRGFDVSCYKYQ